ncbi:hypothetical protein CGZ80_25185 [Rhodopirellula sp. MGV]|nr:hypothetical protein CGZ80_25185 [Rhodopirellula sp. MGV]
MLSSGHRLPRGTGTMRKWKIRTKMIAGLTALAIAFATLVFSSWSQMSRDRTLANEIGLLADEIDLAHGLIRLTEKFKGSVYDLQTVGNEKQLRPHQPLHLELPADWGRISETISFDLDRLQRALATYRKKISEQSEGESEAKLLIDRDQQLKNLAAIESHLADIQTDWNQSEQLQDQLELSFFRADLTAKTQQVEQLTATNFEAVQGAIKQFGEKVDNEHRAKRNTFWGLTIAAFMVMLFLAWLFWTLIVVPFRTLIKGSELIANGHHKHKILLGTNDEIGLMADTINEITDGFNNAVANATLAWKRAEQEVRERTREAIQNEQLASVGFLAAGVAHEINNPLGAIAWSAEALEESLDEISEEDGETVDESFLAELRTNLGLIQSEAFRCKGITKRLLSFSKLSDSSRDTENIGELVERVVALVGKVGEYRCKTIQTHLTGDVRAYCNAQEIQQVVLNLVSNALESVDTAGKVDVYVRQEFDPLTDRRNAIISVEDNGCGMSQEVMDHLFEPFFTRRRDNSGTGLGLSISARIVSLHHGALTPYSDGEGCGSKMVLRLPTEAPKEVSPTALRTPSLPTSTFAQTIAEDSELISKDVEKVA